jgi:hypothetical protein
MNKSRWEDLERVASLLNQAMEIVESIRNDETVNFESVPKREVDSRSTAKPNPVIQQYDAGEPTSAGG